MTRQTEDFKLEIPSFMLTKEYEQKRREHLKRIEEENRRILNEAEKRKRYKLQRQAKKRRIRAIKKIKGAVVKIVLGGMVIVVVGEGLVKSLSGLSSNTKEFTNPHVISTTYHSDLQAEGIQIDNSFELIEENSVQQEEINIDLSYETRKASIDTSGAFAVGSNVNPYLLDILQASEAYPLFIKYGEMYGVDPYILIAKAFQESALKHNSCLPGGSNYNGYGVGIMQHESPDGREIIAHNYLTGEDDVMYLTMENAINLEKNIQMGAMHFQKCLEDNNGNILLAIQSYNYGTPMMNLIIKDYANSINTTVDSVKSNYSDNGWLSLVQEVHNNPSRYVSNWKGSYGDGNYIKNVLRYFIGNNTYYYYNGVKYVFDLNTFEAIEVTQNVNIIK